MWQTILTRVMAALVTLVLVVPSAHAAGEAGFVLFTTGSVTAVGKDGATRDLKRRSAVMSGDTLRTAANARAQVKFADGAIVALKPGSVLRIDEYAYEANGGAQKSVMSLVKGGFRTMTGAIGKLNKADYKVNTPVATIGIRGTLYETWFEEGEGLGLGVWDGGITACNDQGCVDLGMNADHRFGFVPLAGQPRGQSGEPRGVGGNEGESQGGEGGDVSDALAGTLDQLDGDPVADALQPAGLFGTSPEQSRAAYPMVGYALLYGGGVMASDYARLGIFADTTFDPPYESVVDWELVDNASGTVLGAAPATENPQCEVGACYPWNAYINTSASGAKTVWGSWSQVEVGLSVDDPNPGLATGYGYFVMADYVSPADVNAFAAQSPMLYLNLSNGQFDLSGQFAYTQSGSMVVDFAANDVSGNLSVGDFALNNWNINLNGGVSNGELVLGIDTATSTFMPAGGSAGSESLVTGNIEGSFFGSGTVEGVVGGLEVSTVGANTVTGNVETLNGIFQMDQGLAF